MIKKCFSLICVSALILRCFMCTGAFAADGNKPSLSAKSAVLMNADTLEVLYSLNPDEKRPMASTTKIMTALIALEYGEMQKRVTASAEAVAVEGTSIGLKAGDEITLYALVCGMLLESGNDAANVTACALSGDNKSFAVLMNKRAKQLGMNNTCFKNPSGLPEEGHYSTAYDMALLASYAIKLPAFSAVCSQKTMRVSYGTPSCERTFSNHNKLLSMYEGAVGMKTGFTKSSGRCLVSAAVRNGVTLVAVTLCDPDDWNDHITLLDYGFSVSKTVPRFPEISKISVSVTGSLCASVGVMLDSGTEKTVSLPENSRISFYTEHFLYAPVKKGDTVGFAVVKNKAGKEIRRFALLADRDAPKKSAENTNKRKTSFFSRIINRLKDCLRASYSYGS